MTHHTDAELLRDIEEHMRKMWDARLLPAVCWPADLAQRLTQAVRRAPATPVHTTSEHSTPMCGAAPKVEPIAWYVTGCSTMLDEHDAKAEAKRCGGAAKAVPLYAAPQPPEATVNQQLTVEAAPVELPEPDSYKHTLDTTEGIPGNKPEEKRTESKANPFGRKGIDYDESFPWTTEKLYTEQQVRALLAAHGIKVNQ